MCRSVPPIARLWCEQTFKRGCYLVTSGSKAWVFSVFLTGHFSKLDQGGVWWALSWTGQWVLEGEKRTKQSPSPAPSLSSRHLVVEYGCTSQGSGAGKVFTLSPFWNFFLGNHWIWWYWRLCKFHWFLLLPGELCCLDLLLYTFVCLELAFFFSQHLVASFKMFCLEWAKYYQFSPPVWSPQFFFFFFFTKMNSPLDNFVCQVNKSVFSEP